MGEIHYIAMAGLHGCLPQYCQSHETFNNAVEDLVSLHELAVDRALRLKKEGYLELNLHRDGNEYCEITECNCDNPEQHNDT